MSDTNGQGVIWDVDGTLVDTAGLHFQAWAELCRALDRPFTAADFAATFGQRNPEILGKLFGTRASTMSRLPIWESGRKCSTGQPLDGEWPCCRA